MSVRTPCCSLRLHISQRACCLSSILSLCHTVLAHLTALLFARAHALLPAVVQHHIRPPRYYFLSATLVIESTAYAYPNTGRDRMVTKNPSRPALYAGQGENLAVNLLHGRLNVTERSPQLSFAVVVTVAVSVPIVSRLRV